MSKTEIQIPVTLKYWKEDGGFVGQLVEEPEVISQGATLEELKENIKDARELVLSERKQSRQSSVSTKSRRQVCVSA